MAKLLIVTQYMENYGAHSWDGQGECPQYWKAKGGEEYFVANVDLNRVSDVVNQVRNQVEWNNPYSTSHILTWEVVSDDARSEDEEMQLKWEGRIAFPAKYLTVN